MDSAFISPFARSIEEVLSTTMQLFVRTDPPHGRQRPTTGDEVCATVEFTGDVTGTVRLCLPRATAQRLVQLFIGGPFDDADFADALGELAGMVAGRAKARFPASHTVNASCPTVTVGGPKLAAHAVGTTGGGAPMFIPCSSDCGDLTIELTLIPQSRAYSAAA